MKRGPVHGMYALKNSLQFENIGIECNLLVLDLREDCISGRRQCHVWEKVRPEFRMADATYSPYFIASAGDDRLSVGQTLRLQCDLFQTSCIVSSILLRVATANKPMSWDMSFAAT